jgi:hypothetical protein
VLLLLLTGCLPLVQIGVGVVVVGLSNIQKGLRTLQIEKHKQPIGVISQTRNNQKMMRTL